MTGPAQMAATVFGIGYLRPAPGSWGSLAALPLGWALHQVGGVALVLAGAVAVFALGLWATGVMTRDSANHDPSEIVIDEVAGQLVALLPLSLSASVMGLAIGAFWPGWISAFLLFRLFDIWKPWPVSWADRRSDPIGVMLDDILAGGLAALGTVVLGALAHGVLLL